MQKKCPARLALLRHGQSWLNLAKAKTPVYFQTEADRALVAGVPDHLVDLTELGAEQARLTGQGLCRDREGFDLVYDSGYMRTMRTLDGVLSAYSDDAVQQMVRQSSELVRERESGYTYNMLQEEVAAAFPWLQTYWSTHGPVFARPPGGESIADVIKRVRLFYDILCSEAAGKRVLVSMHGRVLAAFRFILEGWSYAKLEAFLQSRDPKNCGVTIYRPTVSGEGLELEVYNRCYWE